MKSRRKRSAEGYSVINLDVRETQEAAVKLYESSGYTLFGTHPFYARVGEKIVVGRYYFKVVDPAMADKGSG